MNLTLQQQKIVNTTANKVVVIASAASGKTATLVARTQFLLDSELDPRSIVVITFTNAALHKFQMMKNLINCSHW